MIMAHLVWQNLETGVKCGTRIPCKCPDKLAKPPWFYVEIRFECRNCGTFYTVVDLEIGECFYWIGPSATIPVLNARGAIVLKGYSSPASAQSKDISAEIAASLKSVFAQTSAPRQAVSYRELQAESKDLQKRLLALADSVKINARDLDRAVASYGSGVGNRFTVEQALRLARSEMERVQRSIDDFEVMFAKYLGEE
jgi:hypothetical protein